MENENILSTSYGILYRSQGKGFLIATWLVIDMKILIRNYKRSIRIHDIFLIIYYLSKL